MKIETDFTRLIGVDYPIIGAPMFLISYEEYVIALAQAGALGAFPLPNYRTTADLEQALRTIRSATNRPIGVNIHLSGRFPWQEQLKLCLDAGVSFFISSLGNPALILDDVHANGGLVFADVISLAQGLKARDRGADGLIAVAAGAGGHCGTIPTLVFVPYLRQKTGLPVVAAGGISTGEQMAAALAVGACAVIVGTRLIATPEARAAPAYKQAVIAAGPGDIVTTAEITGNPATWLAASIADFHERPSVESKRWRDFWSAGQSVAQTETIQPIAEVVAEMAAGYRQACRRLQQTLAGGE
ncbi:MAG: nitronate monooxygenase [Caldilineales bacterium]|nr:nitronate monooxygenase [Caldilineales bacterium]